MSHNTCKNPDCSTPLAPHSPSKHRSGGIDPWCKPCVADRVKRTGAGRCAVERGENMKDPDMGYIVVDKTSGFWKMGHSRSPRGDNLKALQRGNPNDLECALTIHGGAGIESWMHWKGRRLRVVRNGRKTEWFRPVPKLVPQLLKWGAELHGEWDAASMLHPEKR